MVLSTWSVWAAGILGVGGLIGLILRAIYVKKNYVKIVVVKQLNNDARLSKIIRARYYKDKKQVEWWKARQFKCALGKVIPMPPSQAIELTRGGLEMATCYMDEAGQIVWQIDDTKSLEKHNFHPFPTKQRVIYTSGLRDAYARGRKSWTDQLIPIAGMLIMLIAIGILVFGYGEFAKPILDAEQVRSQQLQTWQQLVADQKEMNMNIQQIRLQTGLNASTSAYVPLGGGV